jgi:uncharacterized membrane protein
MIDRISKTVGLLLCAVFLFSGPSAVFAQPVHDDVSSVVRAKVINVSESETRLIPGTDTEHTYQNIDAEILEGPKTGTVVQVENDFLELKQGDHFFLIEYTYLDGHETYSVQDIDRRAKLAWLFLLFVIAVVTFGGWYGVRALFSLGASLFVIFYLLVPGLLGGWDPLLASFLVAGAVLAGVIFITHGPNKESLIAFGGTMIAVAATLLIAAWSVSWVGLSGFTSGESVTLNFNTRGGLDLVALLIGGIIIGAIGVLDDIAITQVAVVRELLQQNSAESRRDIFLRGMRVGREHVGAVVNTLALAYVGVSLPLVLVMYLMLEHTGVSGSMVLNMETFATEMVRTVVGSIGIVLAVPIVTFFAARFLPRSGTGTTSGKGNTVDVHS